MFLSRAQVIVALAAAGLALLVLDLVRRRKLSEDLSLVWLGSSIAIAVLGFSTPLLQAITRSLGILYESSTVFGIGLGFAVVGLLVLSVRLSRLDHQNLVLAREVGLLRLAIDQSRGGRPSAPETDPR